jgi:GntR family transcriptional regulator
VVERAVPLVEQVRQQLLRWIRDETLVADDGSLPSESEIAERLSVSRATVRDALARLERDQVVIRRHGAGTFVNPSVKEFTSGIDVLRDPASLIEATGRKASIGYHDARPSAVAGEAAKALDVSAGQPAIALSVLYLADAQPAIWMDGILPVEDSRAITPPAYATLAQFVIQLTGAIITHSIATLEAATAEADVSQQLKIPPGCPLIRLLDVYLTHQGTSAFYSQSYFAPGLISIQVLRKTDGVVGRGHVSVW